jgi:hypothetical protein
MDSRIYLPEIKLTRKTTPVTTFLFIGAFEANGGKKNMQNPLCAIDPKDNTIHIKAPERLLDGSRTRVVTRSNIDAYLDTISWRQRQLVQVAFILRAERRQAAIVTITTESNTTLFLNARLSSSVSADSAKASGGRGYFPVTLEAGDNLVMISQSSVRGRPRIQMDVCLDHSQDMKAAWQQNGLLKKLVYSSGERADPVTLDWNPNLSGFRPSLEIRDVATNTILLRQDSARRGRVTGEEGAELAPGLYEAIYKTETESASELFIVGNPQDLFAGLQDRLSRHNPDAESKLDIEAQLRRARILLSNDNYNLFDRQFQEKLACTFGCLANMERRLREGAVNIAKNQPGLQIRSFVSALGGTEHYRLYIPSACNPANPLPLLVIPSTRVTNKRPFIEGPVMANQREALLWAKYAEQYGFTLLWPGYRGAPEGQSYESVHINEAIQAVENDYAIDRHRISLYATCGAGYNAGRLISDYNNRFAAIVYDRAVFDHVMPKGKSSPSLAEWLETINPSRHVLDDRNVRIFVMHDNTRPPGHGQMELTIAFLEQARKTGRDVVSYLSDQPMTMAGRMDMIFSWLVPCWNSTPDDARSRPLAAAGYTGPISEIFATPFIVVEGTRASGRDLQNIQSVADSFGRNYTKYFHGAECVIKKDNEVTQDDIDNNSLILIGNPQSNGAWEELQPQLPVEVIPAGVFYNNNASLFGNKPFQIIARHPYADGKFILMLGASNLKFLNQLKTNNLFATGYDCITSAPFKIIGKLGSVVDAKPNNSGNNGNKAPNPKSLAPQGKNK